jgi:hypothetical protein
MHHDLMHYCTSPFQQEMAASGVDPVHEAKNAVMKTETEIIWVKGQLENSRPEERKQFLDQLSDLQKQLLEDKKRLNRVEEMASGAGARIARRDEEVGWRGVWQG